MNNMPKVKVGIVAVSRDCFPESLSVNRRKTLVEAYKAAYNAEDIYECPVCIVESEIHMMQALEDIKKAGCNALCVYLGNFGPEISETLLAKHFDGPKMFVAAAEEDENSLIQGRGDAYCGYRLERPEDYQLWPPSVELPGLQRSHQAAVQPECGNRREQRAGSVRGL